MKIRAHKKCEVSNNHMCKNFTRESQSNHNHFVMLSGAFLLNWLSCCLKSTILYFKRLTTPEVLDCLIMVSHCHTPTSHRLASTPLACLLVGI